MKRAVSLILALTMLMSLAPLAKAEGLSLVPLETDETGVLPQSAFLLTGYSGDGPELILNGEKTAKAEKNPDGTFKMTFDEPFSEKELLKLQLADGGSWAFQSAVSFSVKSTVPGNNAQNVPIKSGIEFSFTHSDLDMESIKENFSIKPKTEGYWEQHKNTAVFVPTEPFEYGEEYSITLKGGAARENGTTLNGDLTVEFRTEKESPVVGNEIFSLTPKYSYFETSSSKAPELAFYRFMTKSSPEPMKIEVFPLREEKALDWLLGNITSKSLSENLPAAMIEMECEIELSKDEVDFTLPQSLENGFYIVRVSENGVSACSVIQSTDIALYMTEDSESYGIWLNDFSAGDALSGAKLYLNGGEISGETDQDGLALIPKGGDDEYIKITANGETAYYPINSYRIEKNRYHVILQTERLIYRPNDTIYVWGAVKPYADETAPEKLRLELTRGYYSATPILTEEITPVDGVFSLPIELPQVSSGSYTLILKDGDEILASIYVSVYEYVKPDYKLTLTADKKAIFLGESIKYTANASFFDSTCLPDLELEAESHEFDFENYSHTAKTDTSGGISFEVLPEYTDDGQGRTSYAMNVQALLPQEGRMYKSVYTTVLLNNISASITSGFEDGVSTVKLHSDTLTTDKVNRGEGHDYTDSPDKGREFKGTLSFMRYVKEETGTKYDYITKKTYKTYKTYEVEEKVTDVSLKTDEDGNASYSFAPTITADGYYKIKLTAVDDFSREYTVSGSVRTSDRYWKTYSRSTSVQLLADKEEYDIGDEAIVVTAEVDGKTVDAMEKKITVTDTYNRTIKETFYDSVYDEIIPGDSGNVWITFTDKNRAMLLRGIYRMRAWAGDRIDQKLANYKAKELLNEYYGAEIELEKPNFSDYQYYDGEIKLLPYSSADEELTYKIAPYIGDFIDKNMLLDYLGTKAGSSSPKVLYALAALGENVLDEVYALSEAENLSVTDRLYAILALCEMGDLEKSGELYERFVRDLCEEYGDEMRIVSGEDEDDILEATSLASLAALYLAPADAEKLYNYCVRNCTTDILINLEIMAYTIKAIENLPEEGGSVTYEYGGESFTKEFKGREAYSVEIPLAKLGDFKVVSASEGVVMASECEKKIDMESIDSPYVSVERKYYKDGESEPSAEFKETDIVRCEISVKYSPQALKGGYIINDYLPSGLEFFKSGSWYVSGSGQRVNISNYFYNDELSQGGSATISYYARVVSAGEYTADRAVISDASSHTAIAATERGGVKITGTK